MQNIDKKITVIRKYFMSKNGLTKLVYLFQIFFEALKLTLLTISLKKLSDA